MIHMKCEALFSVKNKALLEPKSIDIFLISPQKHMLWVLIRSTSFASNEYSQQVFMEKRKNINTFWL